MMKKTGVLLVALMLAACENDTEAPTGPSVVGPIIFTSQLLASNEVPAVTNAEANGRATVTITFSVPRDTAGVPIGSGSATFAMQIQGFAPGTPIVGAHIHPGAAGVNGGIVVPLTVGTGTPPPIILNDGSANLIMTTTISRDLAAQITANPAGYYFNLHTPLNPGGAIRGQLSRLQ